MKILTEINKVIKISEYEKSFIKDNLNLKSYAKNEIFLKNGQRNDIIGFLETGLFRSYYFDNNGNQVTTAFIEEDTFFTDLNSFLIKGISERTIEALIDSKVYFFTPKQLNEFNEKITNWSVFQEKYYQNVLKEKVNYQRKLTNSNATETYKLFAETYKQAVKYAPRQYIASFLGLSPYTLSRIKL